MSKAGAVSGTGPNGAELPSLLRVDSVEEQDHYEVLGVEVDSTEEAIRVAYRELSKRYHPDKTGSDVWVEALLRIQKAYAVLADTAARAVYDTSRGFAGCSSARSRENMESRLYIIQREKMDRAIENCHSEYASKSAHEASIGGLVILRALFGNLRLKRRGARAAWRAAVTEELLEGPFFDVTRPLQCAVEGSRLHCTGASFVSLPGIFNPAPLSGEQAPSLYVLYKFQDRTHEVTVPDGHRLLLPQRTHRLPSASAIRGPWVADNCRPRAGASSLSAAQHIICYVKTGLVALVIATGYLWIKQTLWRSRPAKPP